MKTFKLLKVEKVLKVLLMFVFLILPLVPPLITIQAAVEKNPEQVVNEAKKQRLEEEKKLRLIDEEKENKRNLQEFLSKLAYIESRGNHKVVNRFGYLGKYQFSSKTIKGLGFNITREEFLENAFLQDEVAIAYLKYNAKILKSYIDVYVGKTISGVEITTAGILAAAHCLGPGAVIKFFKSKGKIDNSDGNGIKTSQRIKLFKEISLQL